MIADSLFVVQEFEPCSCAEWMRLTAYDRQARIVLQRTIDPDAPARAGRDDARDTIAAGGVHAVIDCPACRAVVVDMRWPADLVDAL